MPPLPAIRLRVLAQLAEQLRFTPAPALLRHIQRAESLPDLIDPESLYPEDWLISRITGYRPDIDEPHQIPGQAIARDLSPFVERLCDAASLSYRDISDALDADQLARRWSVSRKTIDRYRRLGLIARRVRDDAGRPRLVFRIEPAERFRVRHADAVARAGRYSRLSAGARARIIADARRLRSLHSWSLNTTARHLAQASGKSHEAIRQILLAHDAASSDPIFGQRGPISSRQARLADRAVRRAIPIPRIAHRLNRSTASIRRAINVQRLARLGALPPPTDAHVRTASSETADRVLESPSVRAPEPAPSTSDLSALIALARAMPAPDSRIERAQAIAYATLRHRAAETVASVSSANPQACLLDRAETDLRWAARLKAALISAQLPTLIRALETRLGTPLDKARPSHARGLVSISVGAASRAAEDFDPTSKSRLAGRVSLAVDRAVLGWLTEHPPPRMPGPGRALPIVTRSDRLTDWALALCPWQRWLDPPLNAARVFPMLDPESAALLNARYGYGEPPSTAEELCERFGISPVAFSRTERRALRAAIDLARSSESPLDAITRPEHSREA